MKIRLTQWAFALALISFMLSFGACSKTETFTAKNVVGVWKSSRAAETPISMYDNGEWEVRSADGKVLEYGVWQLVGQNRIMWSHMDQDGRAMHEVNLIISVTPDKFIVQELDKSATTFIRIG